MLDKDIIHELDFGQDGVRGPWLQQTDHLRQPLVREDIFSAQIDSGLKEIVKRE